MGRENVNGGSTLRTERKGRKRTAVAHSGTTFPPHLNERGTKTIPAAIKILTTKTLRTIISDTTNAGHIIPPTVQTNKEDNKMVCIAEREK